MHEHIETILQFSALAAAVFGITLLIILRTVRTENYEEVASQAEMNTVFWPWIKLNASWGFFIWSYKEYYRIKKSRVVIFISLASLSLEIIGFVSAILWSFL